MHIYLPVAEMSVNVFLLLGMGGLIGMISGIFGVGGGFLMTPFLIFIGVPAPVAVASGVNQTVASAFSGLIGHWRRGNVDVHMGLFLLIGGVTGSILGTGIFRFLKSIGQIDVTIRLAYIVLLGFIGALMFIEGAQALLSRRRRRGRVARRGPGRHTWMQGLPFKIRFRKSRLYISALLPLLVGVVIGILVAIMGISGIILVPAMIYLIGMPTEVVVGTSLFNVLFVTANTTLLQAAVNHTVDVVLALLLLLGGVTGAQIGVRVGARLKGDQLRVLLACIVLGVCANLLWGLTVTPDELYSLSPEGG